jgi:hypothetical protein
VELSGQAMPAAFGIAGVALATVIMGKHSASDAQLDAADLDQRRPAAPRGGGE